MNGASLVPVTEMADIYDSLRKPVSQVERNKREGPYPYYGATGQAGWIDAYRQDGKYVLLGEDGAPFLEPDKPKAYIAEGKCWVNNHAHVLKGKDGICDDDYLCLALNWADYTDAVTGSTRLKLPQNTMNRLLIPKMPIEKQRQIAARLKAQLAEVDKARQAAEVQLRDVAALKAKSLESIFRSVGNIKPVGSAAKVQSGYAFKSEFFRTSGVRLLRNANILPGKVYWDETVFLSEDDAKKYPGYDLNDGDVLISLDRPIISSGIKVARVGADDLPALLVQRVGKFILDPKKLDADYLYAYLQTDLFIKEITGHDQSLGVPHISPKQVENIEIPMPDVNVQRSLSGRLTEVLKEWKKAVSAIREQEKDLSILPQKILAQAFEM